MPSTWLSSSLLLCCLVYGANSLFLGQGGVTGSLTPRTGSSWPPYPGAGQGYWARRAGFYGSGNSNINLHSRPKRSPLYLGQGGVVGELTPRTGPSYGGSNRRSSYSSSGYSRGQYVAARRAGALYRNRAGGFRSSSYRRG